MKNYKARYGFTGKEVENFSKRRAVLDGGQNWESLDAFVKWCSENGYQKGIKLRRYDESKPHSPENSFFGENTRKKAITNSKKYHEAKAGISPFCTGCDKECPSHGSGGCDEWQKYFTRNWNQNICIAAPKPEPVVESNAPKVFRYEHPDLVREGIVFEGSCGM